MIDKILPKYKKQIIGVSLFAYLLPTIIVAIVNSDYFVYLVGGLISVVLFPIGYWMGKLVLGIQIKNPYCSIDRLDSFCKMAIYFFGLGSILLGLLYPFITLVSVAGADQMIINGSPAAFGIAYAAYRIRSENVIAGNTNLKT